ncbi:hypothetical protein TNCV_735481 [Trichonephila clavipes]|uniref:Ankyrin repeat protein n=1 Tax=Trichonephila clavipes TaxID=2585209 RepID=A0A8X6VKR6_TRICX|nr:hypothetical protein TNCV_735481 [Trichonephila clavipes]
MIREFITEEATLSTIVVDYIPYQVRRTQDVEMSSSSSSPKKSKQLKKFNKEPTPGDTELHRYCRTLRPADLLQTLLDNPRLDINTKNSAGSTPIHVASLAGSYHCIKFLIEDSGDRLVDFKAVDNEGRTALHCAVHTNALDIAKLLLKRGGCELVCGEDAYGNKAIHYATSDEMKELLRKCETEFQLRVQEGDENDDTILNFAPGLKDFNEFHLYLSTLRIMLINYCEIYDIPAIKQTSGGAIACHDRKECCHFVASAVNTLCLEDFSVMVDLPRTFERLIASLKLVELAMDIGDEVLLYEACAVGFD